MKWQPTEFQRRSIGARVGFEAKRMTRSETNPSFKQLAQICSPSSMRTEIAWRIIYADFTIWLLISVGSHGPSSPNEHGLKSEAKVRERSLPKNMEPASLRKKILNAALITSCCTKLEHHKRMLRISQLTTSTGRTQFSFTTGKSLDLSANRHASPSARNSTLC